jgi:hypothetical protein
MPFTNSISEHEIFLFLKETRVLQETDGIFGGIGSYSFPHSLVMLHRDKESCERGKKHGLSRLFILLVVGGSSWYEPFQGNAQMSMWVYFNTLSGYV